MDNFLGIVKLTVDVAENGHTFEVTFPATTRIELVQQWLESQACVPCRDQLLLCDEVRLEPHRSLASYKLPALGSHVFLFRRSRLMPDAPPPQPEQIMLQEPIFPPPPPASLSGYHSDGADDPAVKVLRLYERQFLFHHDKGLAYFGSSQDAFEACKRLHREQFVQNVALSTAKKNLDHYHKIIDESYTEFRKHYSNQYKRHLDILTNFDRDLEQLRACKLHPSLLTINQRTLVDCVNVTSLRQQADTCANSHKQFHGKVLQLHTTYVALQQDVKEMLYTMPSVDLKRLERMVTDSACILEEESSILQSLRKDVDTVKKLVDDTGSQCPNSLRPHDAVSAFCPMFDVHDKDHLPRMETFYHKLVRVLDHFRVKKHEMSLCVHRCMKRIAGLQSRVRDVHNQLSAFKEATTRQDETYDELKVVQKVGSAYRACLAEIIRRKSDMKLYMGRAGKLAERMAKIRDLEVARREDFLRVQSRYIPRDMLVTMGLFGVPSQCSVDVEPYDADLLDIDMKDLEKYAPTVIFGSHLQCSIGQREKTIPVAESSTADTHSMGDSIINTSTDIDLELVEDELSEEVSGTSKLEVENKWLKAELASVIAVLCNIDPYNVAVVSSEGEQSREGLAAHKTMQALALKDEHARHLKNLLKASQFQSSSYRKRICELEKRLLEQYNELQKLSSDGADQQRILQVEDVEVIYDHPVVTGEDMLNNSSVAFNSMDSGVCISKPTDCRQHPLSNDSSFDEQRACIQDGGNETMSDPSCRSGAGHVELIDTQRDEQVLLVPAEIQAERAHSDFMLDQKPSSADESNSYEGFPLEGLHSKEEELAILRAMVLEKENKCAAVEERLQVALEDADCLRAKLQENGELLDECQINCAELENSLHVAREEARTNQCSADRKAAEYSSLRTSSVKLRGLVERFRQAVLPTPLGTRDFVDSLHLFAKSLASAAGDDGTKEFCTCVRALAERVDWLAQQQAGLLERCTLIEASKARLAAEVATKNDLLKIQIGKRKADKQMYRERICYTRFHVHELAIFSPNTLGHYEAVNRSCPNYYLSGESLALFIESLPSGQHYIIGQIVHIERHVAQLAAAGINKTLKNGDSSSADLGCRPNPYNVPVGTEYFVVTLAVVPDLMPSALLQCSVGIA